MSEGKNGKKHNDLDRLEQLVAQANRRIRQTRARARQVCGRLAEERNAPDGDQEDG